jgi:hypothetical protein
MDLVYLFAPQTNLAALTAAPFRIDHERNRLVVSRQEPRSIHLLRWDRFLAQL